MTSIIIIFPILLSVAFLTLMERKLMAITHFRLGPNKVGPIGILQPISDATKLFTKEIQKLHKTNFFTFKNAPLFFMFIYITIWIILPSSAAKCNNKLTLLLLITIMSMSVFFFIASGWTSNSKYSEIGMIRATAQTISYEISMVIMMISPILTMMMMDIDNMAKTNYLPNIMMMMFITPIWASIMLAEMNRTPFDLSEAESELVSGFNTEYASGKFSMIFIAEYSAIIMISMITTFMLFNFNQTAIPMITMIIISSIVWARTSFPRMRYNNLMEMAWKKNLIISIAIMMFTITAINM